jgi:hypothetical protein
VFTFISTLRNANFKLWGIFVVEMDSCYIAQAGLKLVRPDLLGSGDPSDSASQVAGTTVVCHHTKWGIIFLYQLK